MTRARKRMTRRDGFTLVEVMTAVALMIVASAGILTMQGATTKANQIAQETTVAIDFAQTWMERLKRDSLRWTAVGQTARMNGPLYLSMEPSGAGQDIWNVPAATATEAPAADAYGFEVGPADDGARIRYCMGFRNVIQHLGANPLTGTLDDDTVRVDVRVWWHRQNFDQGLADMTNNRCDGAATPINVGARNDVRVVYLSNVLRWEGPN